MIRSRLRSVHRHGRWSHIHRSRLLGIGSGVDHLHGDGNCRVLAAGQVLGKLLGQAVEVLCLGPRQLAVTWVECKHGCPLASLLGYVALMGPTHAARVVLAGPLLDSIVD